MWAAEPGGLVQILPLVSSETTQLTHLRVSVCSAVEW